MQIVILERRKYRIRA